MQPMAALQTGERTEDQIYGGRSDFAREPRVPSILSEVSVGVSPDCCCGDNIEYCPEQ